MHALDDTIGLQHKELSATGRFNQGAVIARTRNNWFCEWNRRQKLLDKSVFAQLLHFHGEKISGNARAVRVSELKIECIVIATRMEPLHSYAIAKQLPKTNKGTNEGKYACAAANSSALKVMPRRRPT